MRRRDFLKGVADSAAAYPLSARVQQPARPVIGFLSFRSANETAGSVAPFREGWPEIGYANGRSVNVAYRWAEGRADGAPTGRESSRCTDEI